ncbi:hypothetical protein ISS05_03985 [Candidatus Woesearchaeota archaeon]|nr:hypothetical protein [Candidatus Woesearchaeota archaeon]
MEYKKLYESLKKPAVYTGAITGGAIAGGIVGYEISDVLFNFLDSLPEGTPSLARLAEACSQGVQNAYCALSGGGIGGGLVSKMINK